jgi:hypothetical protein
LVVPVAELRLPQDPALLELSVKFTVSPEIAAALTPLVTVTVKIVVVEPSAGVFGLVGV